MATATAGAQGPSNPVIFAPEQQAVINRYGNTGVPNKARRACEYVGAATKEKVGKAWENLPARMKASAATVGTGGLYLGGGAGIVLGGLKGAAAGAPAGPVGAIAGAVVGALGGAVAGAVAGGASGFVVGVAVPVVEAVVMTAVAAPASCVEVMLSDKYKKWHAEKLQTEVLPLLKVFVRDNKGLEGLTPFLCGIKQDVIDQPVLTPSGQLYEKAAIESRIETNTPTADAWAAKSFVDKVKALESMDPEATLCLVPVAASRVGLTAADIQALDVNDPAIAAKITELITKLPALKLLNLQPSGLSAYLETKKLKLAGLAKEDLVPDHSYQHKLFLAIKKIYNEKIKIITSAAKAVSAPNGALDIRRRICEVLTEALAKALSDRKITITEFQCFYEQIKIDYALITPL